MTTATNPASNGPGVRTQGPAAWRLLAAVGFVLGATAFTVQAFVASTSAHAAVTTPAPDPAPECALDQACAPFEVTQASCALPAGDPITCVPRSEG